MARARERLGGFGFGLRLSLALIAALLIVGALAYKLISDRLYDQQLASYSRVLEADAKGFEALGRRTASARARIREIDELLDALGRRPGTVEAVLVGPDNVVRATNLESTTGRRDSDPRIDAALRRGDSYAGREGDPTMERSNFEFVAPVNLPDGRYALETSYTSASFDASLSEVREVLLVVLVLGIIAVGVLFYLFGGRTLLRHHRLALTRATRDGLTNLPNHRAFQDEVAQALAAAGRSGEPLALALVDLDHFKLVNDRRGHAEGDAVLKRSAQVLSGGRLADRPFRIGGDEFALLIVGADARGSEVVVHRLLRSLAGADVAASVGWATLHPGQDAEELREQADAALYAAKRRGGGGAVCFEEIRGEVSVFGGAKREAVDELISGARLSTVFQPIFALRGEDVIGMEALMRPDQSLGLTAPEEVFEIAEHEDTVHELDELCVGAALAAVPQQLGEGLLFLNLAPRTLEQDDGDSGWLLRALAEAHLSPEQVVLEVTERVGARVEPVVGSLLSLREDGFQLAIDDVGTGNAGLELLRRIGADFVKLDQSIVGAAATEPNARGVLMAMATFAGQTGSVVIAEGIEDEETLEFLQGLGASGMAPGTVVSAGQGFFLARPAPARPALQRSNRVPAR